MALQLESRKKAHNLDFRLLIPLKSEIKFEKADAN